MSDSILTMERIDEIDKCLKCRRSRVINLYKGFIPGGNYSSFEKFAFAVASVRNANVLPVRIVASQMAIGPCGWASIDSAISKRDVIRNWMNAYAANAEEIAKHQATGLPVCEEIKSNKEWLCLCAFNEAIKWAVMTGRMPYGVLSLDMVNKLLMDWKEFDIRPDYDCPSGSTVPVVADTSGSIR